MVVSQRHLEEIRSAVLYLTAAVMDCLAVLIKYINHSGSFSAFLCLTPQQPSAKSPSAPRRLTRRQRRCRRRSTITRSPPIRLQLQSLPTTVSGTSEMPSSSGSGRATLLDISFPRRQTKWPMLAIGCSSPPIVWIGSTEKMNVP